MGPCASRPRASPAAGSSSPMDAPAPSGRPSAPDSVLERSGDAADASSAVTTPRAPASSVLGGASAFAPSPSRVSDLDGASTSRFSGTVPPPPTERDELDVFDDDPRLLPHANLPDADLSSLLRRVSASVGPDDASDILAYAATDAASDDAAADDDDTPVASLNQLIAARDWGATLARLIILGPPEDDHPRDHVAPSTDPTPSHVDTTTVRTTKSPSSPLLPLHHAVALGCPPRWWTPSRGGTREARARTLEAETHHFTSPRVGSDLTVVERLLAADPSAASIANANGATPLHAAARRGRADGESSPSCSPPIRPRRRRNRAGDYPLHYACRREITPETTAAVLRAFPAAANRANDDGAYPVHSRARGAAPTRRSSRRSRPSRRRASRAGTSTGSRRSTSRRVWMIARRRCTCCCAPRRTRGRRRITEGVSPCTSPPETADRRRRCRRCFAPPRRRGGGRDDEGR